MPPSITTTTSTERPKSKNDTTFCRYLLLDCSPKSQRHLPPNRFHQDLSDSTLVTTEAILDELLNFFSSRGSQLRRKAHTLTQRIAADPAIVVIAQDPNLRKAALDLYLHRPDKGYSFTDCLSMIIMRQMDITQVLTHDHHFTQEGFTILL